VLSQQLGSMRLSWAHPIFRSNGSAGAKARPAQDEVMKRYYYPELDALRFAAFLLVFLHHTVARESTGYASYVPAGVADGLACGANVLGYGLPLFFFLSAFLITDLLTREKSKTQTVKIAAFYIRRALRIWPLYFVGILIGIASAAAARTYWPSIDYGSSRMFVMCLMLIGNWYFASGVTDWSGNPMTPLWSISIEEQFYLFWPAVLRFGSEHATLGVCAIMGLAAITAEYYLGRIHSNTDAVIWANSFVQFEMFAGGAATALLLRRTTPRFCTQTRLFLAALSLFMWFASAYWFRAKYLGPALSGPSVVIGYLLIALGCATILLSVLGITRPIPPLLVYLGRISFGLYVFHLAAIEIVNVVKLIIFGLSDRYGIAHLAIAGASLLLTIAVAALSYRFYETPFLRLKERFAAIASRPI
jgi:peptidoglycan/LPS O-acetylase OafA/YrhL